MTEANGKTISQFPNARYFVSESELKHAENPNERDRASYIAGNWKLLREKGQLELKPDEYEVVNGLTMMQTRGHNATMQTFRLQSGGQTLFGFADIIPTRHHLPLAWVMGFDLFPTKTLAAKKRLLPLAVEDDWLCLFYHDFDAPLYRFDTKRRQTPRTGIRLRLTFEIVLSMRKNARTACQIILHRKGEHNRQPEKSGNRRQPN